MMLNARLSGCQTKNGLWTKLWQTLLMFQPMLTE